MKTFIICLFALGIRRVNAKDCTTLPTICHFDGVRPWHNYQFNIADLDNELDFCCIISYGEYLFDLNDNKTGIHVLNANLDVIKLLKDKKKTIHIRVTYKNTEKWPYILDPKNDQTSSKEIDALSKFLTDNKISGIVLQYISLYGDDAAPCTVENIITFTQKIKKKIKTLMVGLYIDGLDFEHFSNRDEFDFQKTNDVIDLYFVDMTLSNECGQIVQMYGVSPTQPVVGRSLISLEDQIDAVKASCMDICKVYILLQVPATESNNDAIFNDDAFIFGSYTEICINASQNLNIKRWCLDSLTTIYYQANFVHSKSFYGLTLESVDGDDTTCACGCGRFPISKAMYSGWNCGDLPEECAKIKELDSLNQI